MNNDSKNGLQCSEFEANAGRCPGLERRPGAAEIVASVLSPEARHAFDAHGRSCQVCGLFGRGPRKACAYSAIRMDELEPPKNLLHNILAATSMTEARAQAPASESSIGWLESVRRTFRPSLAGLMRSRLLPSFAMAFFSLSLTLTLAGVKFSDVSRIDWHPQRCAGVWCLVTPD